MTPKVDGEADGREQQDLPATRLEQLHADADQRRRKRMEPPVVRGLADFGIGLLVEQG